MLANSVDRDQMPQNAARRLISVYTVCIGPKKDARLIWVKPSLV